MRILIDRTGLSQLSKAANYNIPEAEIAYKCNYPVDGKIPSDIIKQTMS